MFSLFAGLPHGLQALAATVFTWLVTAAGAAVVFMVKQPKRSMMSAMLGFSAGVMTAASFWSLLAPAIDMASSLHLNPWLTASLGFMAGGWTMIVGDKVYLVTNRYKMNHSLNKRCAMLILSITLHNIPEGMAVGVAFGSLAYGLDRATLPSACLLALGIGLQNFPEGMAVSLPLLRDGCDKKRAFYWGQLSGIVEPIAGVIGALLVLHVRALLPFMLAFAAGAMIYVVSAELIPESQEREKSKKTALFTMTGFVLMMALDVGLG